MNCELCDRKTVFACVGVCVRAAHVKELPQHVGIKGRVLGWGVGGGGVVVCVWLCVCVRVCVCHWAVCLTWIRHLMVMVSVPRFTSLSVIIWPDPVLT